MVCGAQRGKSGTSNIPGARAGAANHVQKARQNMYKSGYTQSAKIKDLHLKPEIHRTELR